jgi:NDP-sugar pyrophosphorylase family protein
MDATWIDMGSPAGLKAACDARLQELGLTRWVGDRLNSTVLDRVSKVGCSVVQNGVDLPEGARVENSILFAGAAVQAGETVKDEIRGREFSWKI